MKLEHLVVFLAVMVCGLTASTTYYKVKCDEPAQEEAKTYIRFRDDVDKLFRQLAESNNQWQRMKSRTERYDKRVLADLVAPGAQIDDLSVWLKEDEDGKKQARAEIYSAIKVLITSFRDTVEDDANAGSHIQSLKLSLLIKSFCSNDVDVQYFYEHVGISTSKRLALLDKISEQVEECR